MSAKTLWAWGKNAKGELGDNTITERNSPVQIGTLTNWSTVENGGSLNDINHTLAVKQDGTLWAWGSNTDFSANPGGQLGDGTVTNRSSPVQIGTLTNWSAAIGGYQHSIAAKTDGTLWAWGIASKFGALGDMTTANKSSPVQIGTLTNWSSVIGAAYNSSFAIKTDHTIWAWGYNRQGQGGVTANAASSLVGNSSPIQIGTLTNWSNLHIVANSNRMGAVKTDGTVWHWGTITGGNNETSSPVQIGTLTNWSKIQIGLGHSLATKTDNTVWAWGYANASGQLGLNNVTTPNATQQSSPTQIGTLSNWSLPFAGMNQSGGIKTDSSLWIWGAGTVGQVGDNAGVSRSSPVQIGTLTQWTTAAIGGEAGLAVQGPAPAPTSPTFAPWQFFPF